MNAPFEYSRYQFQDHDELCLKAGPDAGSSLILIPPLFDEMNRTRRMLCDVMQLLSDRDIGALLPDLPGTNESLIPQEEASLSLWREALTACLSQHDDCTHIASLRGGALIAPDDPAYSHWQLVPAKGNSLLKSMMRTRIAADKEAGKSTKMVHLEEAMESAPLNLAGNIINPIMARELAEARPVATNNIRLARLENDSQPADVKLPGTPLWLRAEPDDDMALSRAIADDLAHWVRQ